MTPKPAPILPMPRRGGTAPPALEVGDQAVRRLAALVLGAAALAERLEELATAMDPCAAKRARTARVVQLRAFAAWGRTAIQRAAVDDDYAQRLCADNGATPAAPSA